MPTINRSGINFIKSFEGFSQEIYKDGAGNNTIGWGHLIPDSHLELFEENIKNSGGKLPLPQCEVLFINDLNPAINYLDSICEMYDVELNQNQVNALTSFIFNTGKFNEEMIERFQHKALEAVGEHIRYYYHDSKGNVEEGLKTRRQAEHDLFFKEV